MAQHSAARRTHVSSLKAYEAIIGHETYTVGWLFDLYMESRQVLSVIGQVPVHHAAAIQKMKGADTGRGQFGDAKLVAVTKRTIRTYLDEYLLPSLRQQAYSSSIQVCLVMG